MFKRVKAPKPGTRRRITIQIGVEEKKPVPAAPRPLASYAWFWQEVPAKLDAAAAERFAQARAALEAGAQGNRKLFGSTDLLQDLSVRHATEIEAAVAATGVSAALILAVMTVESGGEPSAVSPKGARGLMQLMPGTAQRFGVSDASDPAQNIMGGARYLAVLLRQFGEDPVLTLAGYNAGENAVLKHQGVPPYAETRDYVPKVLGAWLRARALCDTPPESMRDACELRG